jgi:hypothetical protein
MERQKSLERRGCTWSEAMNSLTFQRSLRRCMFPKADGLGARGKVEG